MERWLWVGVLSVGEGSLVEGFAGDSCFESFEEGDEFVDCVPFYEEVAHFGDFRDDGKEIEVLGQAVFGAFHIPEIDWKIAVVFLLLTYLCLSPD